MRPDAIAIPQRAVLDGPQGKFVYLVDAQSKVEMRPVEVGDWQGEDWIIHKGLEAGDKVIVAGLMKIGPGAPVHIASPAAAKPGAPKPPSEPAPAKK
jgi:membrane fusion protein (multidrug efflux system)